MQVERPNVAEPRKIDEVFKLIKDAFENNASSEATHVFQFRDKVLIGEMSISFKANPTPHYYLNQFHVVGTQQGKGYGRIMLEAFKEFIQYKKTTGVLFDDTDEVPNKDFYKSHGWSLLFPEKFNNDESFVESKQEEKLRSRFRYFSSVGNTSLGDHNKEVLQNTYFPVLMLYIEKSRI
jgi:GNAT superfamily N-acetyltransferase